MDKSENRAIISTYAVISMKCEEIFLTRNKWREGAVRFASSEAITAFMTDWITDRRPTKADANKDGDVKLRVSPCGAAQAYVHWSIVAEGQAWQHSPGCRPAPEQRALALGQKWRRRDGRVVEITRHDTSDWEAPFQAGGIWYRPDGKANIHHSNPELELVELITQSATTAQSRRERRIVAISTAVDDGVGMVVALADDGTAWVTTDDDGAWRPLPPLPPIEERH